MSESEQEAIAGIVNDMLADERTRGLTVVSVGPELSGLSATFSDGQKETSVSLCAQMLVEHLELLDIDRQEFVRDVVNELNDRPVQEISRWDNDQSSEFGDE